MMQTTDIVFLHGGEQAGWIWEHTVAALALQCGSALRLRSILLEVPGCGSKRDRDTSRVQPEDVVEELLRELDASGARDALLVGHSQAGTLMPRLLSRRPDLFRRALYVTCCAPLPGQSVLSMMGSGRHGENPDEVGWPADRSVGQETMLRLAFCNDMSPAQSAWLIGKLGNDHWPAKVTGATDWSYDGLRTPSTYVICLRDHILPEPWQFLFADRLGVDDRIRIDAGHQVMNTRPHALAEVIRQQMGLA